MKQRITLEFDLAGETDLRDWNWHGILAAARVPDEIRTLSIVAEPTLEATITSDPDPFANAWWVVAATIRKADDETDDYDLWEVFEPSDGHEALRVYNQHLQNRDLITACVCRIVDSTDHEGAGQAYIDLAVLPRYGQTFDAMVKPLKLSGKMREVPFAETTGVERTVEAVAHVEARPTIPNPPPGLNGHDAWAIRELLKGKQLQARHSNEAWIDMPEDALKAMRMVLDFKYEYRIKPEAIERWTGIYANGDLGASRATKELAVAASDPNDPYVKVLCTRLDPDNFALIVSESRVEDLQ